MIKVIIVPGTKREINLDSSACISEILTHLNLGLRENQAIFAKGAKIEPKDFNQENLHDGVIIIASGARAEAPTPKLKAVMKFLRARGFEKSSGGKGDHIKFKNKNGEMIILNPDNRDKQHLDLGCAKSLAKTFNMNLVQLYAAV